MVPSISSLSCGHFSDDGIFSGIETSGAAVTTASLASALTSSHRLFGQCLRELEEVLLGYVLPEPFFSEWLKRKLDELFQCLRDLNLPLLALEVSQTTILSFYSLRSRCFW